MFNLQHRINGQDDDRHYLETRIAVRDRLIAQEMKDLENTMRTQKQWRLQVPNSQVPHEMILTVTPHEGIYKSGTFRFQIRVMPEYNNIPPVVKCLTKLWHPNITEDGAVCLSILRQNSLDQYGWKPTRNLREVVQGLTDLFGDLMDFGDPLNIQAAQMWSQNKDMFQQRVNEYIRRFC
uniref:E2 NEDD8-conjugating enzyme n=1 Tax=Caenorhabditis tropicalis TaxID=1561998 RepID=A0A1I7UDQ2_9PELO